MVKPQQVGALSPAHPMEVFMSCLVWSLPLRLILRTQELDFIPTTPQSSRVSFRHCPFSDLQVLSRRAAQHMYWNDSGTHERTLGHAKSTSYATNSMEATNRHAAYLQPWAKCGKRMCGPCCRGFISNKYKTTRWVRPSFDSTTVFSTCDHLGDALNIPRDVRSIHTPVARMQVRKWQRVPRLVSLCYCVFCLLVLVSCAVI